MKKSTYLTIELQSKDVDGFPCHVKVHLHDYFVYFFDLQSVLLIEKFFKSVKMDEGDKLLMYIPYRRCEFTFTCKTGDRYELLEGVKKAFFYYLSQEQSCDIREFIYDLLSENQISRVKYWLRHWKFNLLEGSKDDLPY